MQSDLGLHISYLLDILSCFSGFVKDLLRN
jgi:hypothetical protein